MQLVSRFSRRHWLAMTVVILPQAGCGTIFWPERKGQPPGPLDPKVVFLDAIGLLLFFIPGVIAFAVDFNNGTIYLPPGEHVDTGRSRWRKVRMARRKPIREEIEAVVQAQTGKVIRLQPGAYQVGKLKSAAELDDVNLDEVELAMMCEAGEVSFRCQSEE
ncbi:MAG: hypothetical protein JSS49_26815 [Planctomycetes bacterium]|nr:hypothetical protein [Planctomycetota bacterium]